MSALMAREQLLGGTGLGGAALACCLVAAAVTLRCWVVRGRRQALSRGSRQQEAALEAMGQSVGVFRRQNPGLDEESVLVLPLAQLVQKLKNQEVSPEVALYSYLGKAWEVTKEINCVTNYLRDCKAQLAEVVRQPQAGGLLYGVPISLKECFQYKDQDSTLGLCQNIGFPATEDSVVVQVLKKQGAIPFVHTNVPQSMLSYDCSNPIFGRTLNPLNFSKSPGGSSGGEGALIAGGGSILGLGTDIGGSIRFPAAFCGICGLKPTSGRISKRGVKNCVSGQLAVLTSVGPMAKDVDSLALCLRALLSEDMFLLDPMVPPVPFRETIYASTKPLRIGYYESDGYTMPSPSMKRAVLETKALLEAAGHTLIPFMPSNIDHAMEVLFTGGLFSDGGQAFLKNFKGDSVDPCLGHLTIILRMPNWIKGLLSVLLRPLFPRLVTFLCSSKSRSAGELWNLHHKIEEYQHSVITQWKMLNLDVVLTPMLSPALNINYPGKVSGAVSYTMLYNCLDFPAGVVPVSTVTPEDEKELQKYQGCFGDIWDLWLRKSLKNSVGMPVAVQCVALPWQDELCLRFMHEVERVSQEARKQT
ncbi:fatty-acid amide hydrolase 1-like [Notamacropus eugenii]|uniref:fatty-acid amide hydrolase 1-like n=1 Tax=Notamacropus eugenii TaxID=9315 RepID=UPI003B682C14